MISLNSGVDFRTKVKKGKIEKNSYVKVTNPLDWETKCLVKDEDGNEEEYSVNELMGFGILEKLNVIFDIEKDYYKSADECGNKDVLKGRIHITENVRSGIETFKFLTDCRYSSLGKGSINFKYKYKELTDEEITNILLDEILYDKQPGLQSISCVGTDAKGIDKDPNYHDGHYFLPNDKDYTMTWCRGTVIIREGVDGGWYKGKSEVGRTIYEGKMDWERYKLALIKKYASYKLRLGAELFKQFPEIEKILCDSIKNEDRFKLNKEF